MQIIKLKIIFAKTNKNIPKDSMGYYEGFKNSKKITIVENKETKDTLIHELTHFLLDVLDEGGFKHTKKFEKIKKFLKKTLM